MGIGSISGYSNYLQKFNVPAIPQADTEQIKRTGENTQVQQNIQDIKIPRDIDLSIEEKQPAEKGNTDVTQMSLSFNKGEDYGYIGKDKDIDSLDMQKAISDMKKDQVLQQYQYFVGSSENLFPQNASEDGLVFLKF